MTAFSEQAGEDRVRDQRRLVEALHDARCYPHPVDRVSVIETHISFVLLTGRYAYKIKKALNLGFLDFASLGARRHFCEEEVRLNARLAPEIYVDVAPIAGPADAPRVDDPETPVEYAVRMVQFPQSALVDQMLEQGLLEPSQVDAIAAMVAGFHARAARAGDADAYGSAKAIRAPCLQNFEQLRPLLDTPAKQQYLTAIEHWSRAEFERLREVFEERRRDGFVRECHGDLHLANLVWLGAPAPPGEAGGWDADEGAPQAFDCIEFNDNLRWIDVASELAFLVMDLAQRGRRGYAHRLLSAYLECSGDYAGLRPLRFYLVYRALVRAKVAAMHAAQPGVTRAQQTEARAACDAHLAYATGMTKRRAPVLMLTHGWSGSGKTYLSQPVLEATGAVRVRSDVERKRLHGLPALARAAADPDTGLYGAAASDATYAELERLAGVVLEAGFPVIVDAAFLRRDQRDRFRALAQRREAHFLILDCRAPVELLRARIRARQGDASDATPAVLEHQLAVSEPLGADELAETLPVDTQGDLADALAALRRRMPDLGEDET